MVRERGEATRSLGHDASWSEHRRRSIRLKGYDYSQPGAYFVTIVTQDRLCLFGDVVEDRMRLNGAGEMAKTAWEGLPRRFRGIGIDVFVVMPNHVHGIIAIDESVGASLVALVGAQDGGRATTRVAPTLGDDVASNAGRATTGGGRKSGDDVVSDAGRATTRVGRAFDGEDDESVGASLVGAQDGGRATTRVAPTLGDDVASSAGRAITRVGRKSGDDVVSDAGRATTGVGRAFDGEDEGSVGASLVASAPTNSLLRCLDGSVTIAVGISRGANEGQSGRCRQDCPDGYARGMDACPAGRSNEAQLTPSLHEDLHRVPAFIGILRGILHQQANGHLERVNPGLLGYLKPQRLKDLRDYERRPYLLENHHPLGRPQKAQLEVLLDQLERHLDIPPASVDLGHGCNREGIRLPNVGDVAAQRIALSESHQPNGVLGPVSAVDSQPHDAIEDIAPTIEGMYHLVAGLCSKPAQPVATPLREPVKPGEAEVSQVCQHQCSRWQARHQVSRQHLLVLMRVRLKHDGPPLLASHVEHAGQLASEQTAVAFGNLSQRGKPSRHGVHCTLVYTHHLLGEWRQLLRDHSLKSLSQHAADLLEEPLQWLGSRAMEPLVDCLVCNRESGEEPELAFRDKTPDRQLAAEASQDADQQSRPQSHCGQNARPARALDPVVWLHVLQTLPEENLYIPNGLCIVSAPGGHFNPSLLWSSLTLVLSKGGLPKGENGSYNN